MPWQTDKPDEYRDVGWRHELRETFSEKFKKPMKEWRVVEYGAGGIRLESLTHDDDVQLKLSGNFLHPQAMKVAQEICDQLNRIEELDATLWVQEKINSTTTASTTSPPPELPSSQKD